MTNLISESLLQVEDLATNALDLQGLLDSGLVNLETLVGDSLVGLSDLSLDQIDIAGLIGSGLADLGDLVQSSLLDVANVTVEEFLESQLGSFDGIGASLLPARSSTWTRCSRTAPSSWNIWFISGSSTTTMSGPWTRWIWMC